MLIVCGGQGTLCAIKCIVQIAETWPLLLLFRPGNKASPCTCKDQTTCINKVWETLTLTTAEMEEWVATPLILDYRVLCDDWSTSAFIACFMHRKVFSSQGVQDLVILTCRNF